MTSNAKMPTIVSWMVVVFTLLALTLPSKPAHAQTSFGALIGTITDNTGAVIPNVDVTITNTATGIARQMKTNALGDYRAVSLLPGPYKVSAQHAGFSVAQSDVVDVIVGATVTVNLTMQVGSNTQTVEVTASIPLLNTEDNTVGTLVNHTDMVELPLNGRAYTQLIQLMPGSVAEGGILGPGNSYSLNGISQEQTLYIIDGVFTNEQSDNKFSIQPSVDAIQEFNVETNIASARYGGGAGGVVNVVTVGGTNQLHGAAWEFDRNTKFNAANFFTNYVNKKIGAYNQNQYGVVVGGPVMIPSKYDGRDKTFFMFNWEPFKERQAGASFATLPTAAQLAGDFTAPGLNPIYNPYLTTSSVNAQGQTVYTPTQFSCNGVLNVICPNLINPASTAYAAALLPAVNTPGPNNYFDSAPLSLNMYQLTARVDQKIGSKLNFFARYSMMTANQVGNAAMPSLYDAAEERFKNPEVSLTWLINPTTVLDMKLGVHRSQEPSDTFNSLGAPAAAFNAKYPAQGVANRGIPSFYEDNWSGYTSTSSRWFPQIVTVWNPNINLTKMAGRNSMEMGYSMVRNRDYNDGLYSADYNYDNVPTSNPNNVSATGDPIASFLLELPSGGERAAGDSSANYRWTNYAGYFTDSIKVSRKLTADVGLRYEYDEWPTNPYGHIAEFDPDAACVQNPSTAVGDCGYVWAAYNPANGQGPNAQWPSVLKPWHNGWAPRIGLAYQATHNTTIRSGAGMYHGGDLLWEAQSIRGQWPYAIAQGYAGTNRITPNDPVSTYFPAYTSIQPGTPPTAEWSIAHNEKTTYSMQWNLDVQHEFSKTVLLDVDYIGSHTIDLPMFFSSNNPQPGPGTIGSAQHPRPINNITGVGQLLQNSNYGRSNYEALQVKFQKRFSNGLQFLAFYVYSKEEDLAGGSFGSEDTPQNPRDWEAEWADGTFDLRQTFKASWVYQLPVGRGMRWLSNSNAITDAILGGWNVSGIATYHTGFPVNVGISFDNANTGTGQRPNYIPGFPMRVISSSDRTHGWLNPAQFVVAPQYTFGNLGRDAERGPGSENWDFSVYKNFKFREGKEYLQFRAESFNLWNNVNFGNPGSTLGTSSFGVISSAAAPRYIQLALKLVF